MPTKTKAKPSKTTSELETEHRDLMYKTIANLTDIVSQLEHDVKKVKTRLGI